MAFISGYDLEIKFNLRLINSLADAEACADALAQVFYDALDVYKRQPLVCPASTSRIWMRSMPDVTCEVS